MNHTLSSRGWQTQSQAGSQKNKTSGTTKLSWYGRSGGHGESVNPCEGVPGLHFPLECTVGAYFLL
ncbi:MAG: hypothetical protein Q8L11_05050 [Candidatus Moranbacteria bacterium]|nr:hypothetical protein [Candidatus Moranbacteria bacterium]